MRGARRIAGLGFASATAGAGGFTLIEVLVALAIVTVGMAAVMGALTSSASTTAYLRDKTFAQWVALNRIATLRLSGQQPQTGKSDGDTDFAGRSWHWHQEVVTTEVPGVERIDVSVRPADLKVGLAADDRSWLTTVSGIWGDAVDTPNGWLPDWGSQFPGGPGQGTAGNNLGSNPANAPAPPGQPVTPQPRKP